jgi:hypothetical protein
MFEILKNVQKPAEIKTCKKIMRLIQTGRYGFALTKRSPQLQ